MPVKRCLNFRLREREARKWTFVRDWEKEPTPSERDFRTSVSDVTWSVCMTLTLMNCPSQEQDSMAREERT